MPDQRNSVVRSGKLPLRLLLFVAGIAWTCALWAQPVFTVGNPVCSQFEDGPPLGAIRPVPGETVHIAFTATGFRQSETGRVALTGHVQVFDPAGIPLAPKDEVQVATTLREEDTNWRPKFHGEVTLPAILEPGTYKVRFDAADDLSGQSASGETSFEVQAKLVAPNPTLIVRELTFFRNQDDTVPLITPSFRAGDLMWVKFYIVGFQHGEQNSTDVSYDVELIATDGTSIMKKEDAATEKNTAWYPQPYVPGIFNLALKATMTKAVYTLVITAHDAIGNRTATAQAKFQVN